MEKGYFSAAWGDITKSPGWFSKILRLGLLNLIPIFGVIVTYGYLYGWARDIDGCSIVQCRIVFSETKMGIFTKEAFSFW